MDLRPNQVPSEKIRVSTKDEKKTPEGSGVTIHREYHVPWSSVLDENDTVEVQEEKTTHSTSKNWSVGTEREQGSFTIPESEVIERVNELERESDQSRGWLTKVAIERIIKDREQIQ